MTLIARLPIFFGPPKPIVPEDPKPKKKPEEIVAEKKRTELDTALGKHSVDEAYIEELKGPIRDQFTLLETIALKKFDDSLTLAPWTKMLLGACPNKEDLKAQWEKAVPALDTKLGKLNAYRFQVGVSGSDPLLKGTDLEGVGMKGILEVCWAGKVPKDLQGLVMKKEFVPPSEFPTWTKKNRTIPPK